MQDLMLVVVAAVVAAVAIVYAFVLMGMIGKEEEGTERMIEISKAIRDGAKAFLFAEYKSLVVVIARKYIFYTCWIYWYDSCYKS